MAYAIYQRMMLTEDGSKEHYEQLIGLLRTLHPIALYDVWLKNYCICIFGCNAGPHNYTSYGHLNVLPGTQRPKAAVIVTGSIFCFLDGKRSKTAYTSPSRRFGLLLVSIGMMLRSRMCGEAISHDSSVFEMPDYVDDFWV